MKRSTPIFVVALFAAHTALANDTEQASAPQMPQPAAELERLKFMLGNWDIHEQHEAWPGMHDAFEADGRDVIVMGPGGFSVTSYYSSKSEMGPSVGHNMVYWDADENVYKSIWFDSWSPEPSFSTGKWEGDKLVFTGTVEMAGQSYAMKYEFADISADGFEMAFWMNDRKAMTMSYTPEKLPRSAQR